MLLLSKNICLNGMKILQYQVKKHSAMEPGDFKKQDKKEESANNGDRDHTIRYIAGMLDTTYEDVAAAYDKVGNNRDEIIAYLRGKRDIR